MKQDLRVFRPARHFIEARRAQLIGVDVRFIERHRDRGQFSERLHEIPSASL
jgi:hypothetical protein